MNASKPVAGSAVRTIQRAYKTELRPNSAQRQSLAQHSGAVRFLYNLALERCQAEYALSKASGRASRRPGAMSLNKELTELKRSEDGAWLYGVSNSALQNALRQLDAAYANFFRRVREGKAGRTAGFPHFKSKKHGVASFKLNGAIHVREQSIQLPTIGTVRLKERGYLPIAGIRVTSATVSEAAGRWYVAIQVEEEIASLERSGGGAVGIDLGLNTFAVLSDGTAYHAPRPLRRHEKKLKRLQRSLSRKQKGSQNRAKARLRLTRHHQRVGNIRRHFLHIATTEITNRYDVVVLEDLAVTNMLKNHCLAKSISDAGWAEFRRQLAYKLDWAGGTLVIAPRFFASTKQCSGCGAMKERIDLSERRYVCTDCGLVIDRDLNAALNLEQYVAGKQPDTLNACGGDVRQLPLALADLGETGTHAQTGRDGRVA